MDLGDLEELGDIGGENDDDNNEKKKQGTLQQLNVDPNLIIHLKKCGFGKLTQTQEQAIPQLITGQDTILIARTGSGKTIAYLLPLIHKLGEHKHIIGIRSIILVPSRELAMQVYNVIGKLTAYQKNRLRTALITGGSSLEEQFRVLSMNVDIVVATPGRFVFLLSQVPTLSSQLKTVQYAVLDEADRLFEEELGEQVIQVTQKLGGCQLVLCSATYPASLKSFAGLRLRAPAFLQLLPESFPDTLQIVNVYVHAAEFKELALVETIQKALEWDGDQAYRNAKMLVFMATRYHVEYFLEYLAVFEIKATGLYGSMDQAGRNAALRQFSQGDTNVLLCTDVAGRGLDLQGLDVVINFNFPPNARTFLHRGGRVARNGAPGLYINIIDGSELPYLLDANIWCGNSLKTIDLSAIVEVAGINLKIRNHICSSVRQLADNLNQEANKLLQSGLSKMKDDYIFQIHQNENSDAVNIWSQFWAENQAQWEADVYLQLKDQHGEVVNDLYALNKNKIKTFFSNLFNVVQQAVMRNLESDSEKYDILQQKLQDFKSQIEIIFSELKQWLQNAGDIINKSQNGRNVGKIIRRLRLPEQLLSTYSNGALVRSGVFNQIGTIPQLVLDTLAGRFESHRQRLLTAAKSMHNSAQQLRKQKKSASSASVERAKVLKQELSDNNHHLMIYFGGIDQMAVNANKRNYKMQYTQNELQNSNQMQSNIIDMETIQNYTITTERLKKQAEAGDPLAKAALRIRMQIEHKSFLLNNKQMFLTEEEQNERQNQQGQLFYNNPEVMNRLDQCIQQEKEKNQLIGKNNAFQSLIVQLQPSKSVQSQNQLLEAELQPDEIPSLKGQHDKKVWDPKKMRYVTESSLKRQKEKHDLMVQSENGEWQKSKGQLGTKTLYAKWTKKTHMEVAAGGEDDVTSDQASKLLSLQGLYGRRKIIRKQQLGLNKLTTASDKFIATQSVTPKKKQLTKEAKLRKKAFEKHKKREIEKGSSAWKRDAIKRRNIQKQRK